VRFLPGPCIPLLLIAWGLAACAPWDLRGLERRYPELERVGAAPLAELVPYFVAVEDELTAFTCRWPTGSTLGVRVAGPATPADLEILDRALSAWQQASLGIRFERVESVGARAAIEVRFDDTRQQRSGTAAVDCRARPGRGERLEASLVSALVVLRRENLDWKGGRVALSREERLGAALHELGHALGFQGHPRRGDTVMLRSVDHVRWAGAALEAGEPFYDASLAALYALPSGTVLARRRLPAGRTRELDAASQGAAADGDRDWWIRVGDRAARLHWGPGSARYSVFNADKIFRNPKQFNPVSSSEF